MNLSVVLDRLGFIKPSSGFYDREELMDVFINITGVEKVYTKKGL